MNFLNYTPHVINLNDGTSYTSQGVARVSASFTSPVNGICSQQFGDVEGLPEPQENTMYIVSFIVLSAALAQGRTDCVAPASGHPDTVRNERGHIVSVPCFVQ